MRLSGITLMVAALLAGNGQAQDAPIIGPVYPVTEPHLIDVILGHLRHAESTGVLGQLQRDAQARVRRSIEQPQALETLRRTTHARSHYHDPGLVVPDAIRDVDGRVLIAPGTRVNPLETVSLSKPLLFFDGRDAAQIRRARALLDQHGGKVKLILTGGSYLDLMKQWRLPVFFDQGGRLTQQLNIRQVPALVVQDGKRLRIDEIQ